MSIDELVEQIKALTSRERRRLVEIILGFEEELTPPAAPSQRARWPDVETRAKRIFGNKIIPNLVLMERRASLF